jgi:hypothetical protein
MDILQWAVGILVTIQMAVTGWFATQLWAHVTECRRLGAQVEGLSRDVERMKQDVGTHETGLRGAVHKTANQCTALEMRVGTLERR